MSVHERRQGVIVHLQSVKFVKMIRKFGNIHYISRRMKYVVMYIDKEQTDDVLTKLQRMNYVKKVELSYKPLLKTVYESKKDKAKEYDYKMGL